MARRVKTVTIKAGTTANDRKVLNGVSAATTPPSNATDGHTLQQNEYIHLLFEVGGTVPVFRVRIWWYFEVSGRWHEGELTTVNANDCVLVEAQGADRVQLAVEGTPSGTSPTLSAWIALARPV